MDVQGTGIHYTAVLQPRATSLSPTALSNTDLDGEEMSRAGELYSCFAPTRLVVSATQAIGAYSLDPITVADAHNSEQLTPTSVDGGWSLFTTKLYHGEIVISLPAQASTVGRIYVGTVRPIPFTPQA